MASADGSILIRTKVDTSGIKTGTKAIQSGVGKINNSLLKLGGTIATVFSVYKLVEFGKAAIDAASKMSDAMVGLQSIVEGTGNSFEQATNFINAYVSDGLVPATNAVTAYKNLLMRGYTTEQIEKVMTALKDSSAFGRQASLSLGDAVQSATEGLKNENSILVDNAGVTKNVSKMWEDYAASIGTTANALTKQQKIQAEVNGILQETRFQTGDAAKLADTWSGKIATLTFNWNKFLVLVGGQLIQVLTPVVNILNNLLVTAINLGNAMANIFGWETEQASVAGTTAGYVEDTASSQEDVADATNETNKALKKQLAFFDDIHVLAIESASSGGGAGTPTGGTAGGFTPIDSTKTIKELSDLEKKMLDMLNRIKKAWETDADFTFLGVALGNAINDMLNSIDWDAIKKTAYKIGKAFATFLNGAIETIDWTLVGKTLAEGVNTMIILAQGFIENFDFKEFGKAIGDGINGFFKTTDFVQMFDNASDLAIGLMEAISAALDETDFVLIGEKIADGLEAVDWNTLFATLGTLMSEAIGGGIDILAGIRKSAEESDAGKGELEKMIPDTLWEWLDFGGATIGLDIEFVASQQERIDEFNEALEKAKATTDDTSLSLEELQKIVDGMNNPWVKLGVTYDENGWNTTLAQLGTDIAAWWDGVIVVWWDTKIVSFWEEKVKPWFTIEKWQELGQGVLDGISTKWEEFLEWWESTGIPVWFEENVATWFTIEKWEELGQGIYDGISAKWEELVAWWGTAIVDFWNTSILPWFSLAKWKEIGKNMQDGIKAGFKSIVGWIVGILNKIIDSFESMINFVVDGANSIVDKFNLLSSKLNLGYTVERFGNVDFGNIPIPKLAQGAVLPPNKPFMSIVGDQKNGTNVEAPLETIKQALAEVMSSYNSGGNGNIIFKIGETEVARTLLAPLLNEMSRQGLDTEVLGVV